jgi:hypothetical protein
MYIFKLLLYPNFDYNYYNKIWFICTSWKKVSNNKVSHSHDLFKLIICSQGNKRQRPENYELGRDTYLNYLKKYITNKRGGGGAPQTKSYGVQNYSPNRISKCYNSQDIHCWLFPSYREFHWKPTQKHGDLNGFTFPHVTAGVWNYLLKPSNMLKFAGTAISRNHVLNFLIYFHSSLCTSPKLKSSVLNRNAY